MINYIPNSIEILITLVLFWVESSIGNHLPFRCDIFEIIQLFINMHFINEPVALLIKLARSIMGFSYSIGNVFVMYSELKKALMGILLELFGKCKLAASFCDLD